MTAATTSTMLHPEHSVHNTPRNSSLDNTVSTNRSNSLYLDEEPWDEPRQQKVKSPLMACVEGADQIMRDRMSCEFYDRQTDDDVLEDGDLPPLSLKKKKPPVGGRLVAGQLTTARPMSPPSQAGLLPTDTDDKPKPEDSPATLLKKHSQFWSQLDPPSPENVEEVEEGPDDELADRQATRRRWEADSTSKSRDDVESADRSERPRVGLVETDSNSETNTDNFCDYTLQTLGNICGGATESPQRTVLTKPKKSMSLNRRGHQSYDVYEHTAIEVEYVEPPPPVEAEEKKEERDESSSVTSGSWTPNRKNAYLATMARKAKEDFEKSQAQRANMSGAESPVPASPRSLSNDKEEDPLPDDVYNSFSATEKRKFLKLINSGLTSTESIKQVLAERKSKEEPPQEVAKIQSTKSAERGIFSFWKKGSSKGNLLQRARSAPKTRPFGAMSLDTSQSEASLNSSGYKSAPTSPKVEAAEAASSAAVADPEKQTLESVARGQSPPTILAVEAVSSDSAKSESGPPVLPTLGAPVVAIAAAAAAPSQTRVEQAQVTKEESFKPSHHQQLGATTRNVVPQAIAVAAVASAVKSVPSREARGLPELEDEEGHDRFARSGIKYYDAVDKERPDEEDEVEEELEISQSKSRSSRTARLASIRLHPKAQGFSSLGENYEKADQRSRSKSLAEVNRSATISPDGLRRRTLLGIPLRTTVSPTSFAALQDESVDVDVMDEKDNPNVPDQVQQAVEPVVNDPSPRSVPSPSVSAPLPRVNVPPPVASAPPSRVNVPPPVVSSPPSRVNVPPPVVSSPPSRVNVPPPVVSSPPSRVNVPPPVVSSPPSRVNVPQPVVSAPPDVPPPSVSAAPARVNVPPPSPPPSVNVPSPSADVPSPHANATSPREAPSPAASSPPGPSAGKHMVEVPEEAAADQRVENELLRLTSPSNGVVDDNDGQSTIQTELDLASPSSRNLQPSPINRMNRVEITGMDLGIDTYLDSTNIFSAGADHMSVISGRSGWTTGTGLTGATMSSRKRRPGAARERLAKAKEAETVLRSKNGWHDSIRAAAANTNRAWDPEKGWVDYKDPQAEAHGEKNSERIRISLDTVSLTAQKGGALKSQPDSAPKSSPVPVPFPEKWERERLEMINGDKKVSRPGVGETSGPGQSSAKRALSPTESGAAQGSALSPTNLNRRGPAKSGSKMPSVGRSAESTPVRGYVSPTNVDSSGAVGVPMPSVGRPAETTPVRGYQSIVQGDASVGDLTEPMSNLNDWIEQSADGNASKSELSTLDSETVVTVDPTGGKKYMQLGDNGSVKSLLHDPPSKSTTTLPSPKKPFFSNKKYSTPDRQAKIEEESEVENDALPLLEASGKTAKAPEVEVVKEMCDEDDIDLFNSKVTENVENNVVSMGSPSSRRSGPVDVDEVDDLSSSSDEDDEAWEADPFMLGIVSPSLLVRKRDSQPSSGAPAISPSNSGDGSIFSPSQKSSVSASSKVIPKLTKSKKDTSPVRETQSSNAMPSRRGRSAADGSQRISDQYGVVYTASHSDEPSVNEMATSKSQSKQIERGEMADAAVASSNVNPAYPDQHLTQAAAAKAEAEMDASGRSASSIVKLRAQQWETRSSMSPVDFTTSENANIQLSPKGVFQLSPKGVNSGAPQHRDTSGATAEWKSFLGKKVRTESAVAAKQQENLKAQSNREPQDPVGENFSPLNQATLSRLDGNGYPVFDAPTRQVVGGRRDEERDSLFDFEHRSNVNRVLNRERETEKTENAPVDASPSRAENREGDDANHESDDGLDGDVREVEREYVESEVGTVDRGSFLQRLKACAATDFPAAHLAFMRTNAGVKNISSRFMPATLCGTPDVILKDDDTEDLDREPPGSETSEMQFPESIRGKPRSRSAPRIESRPSSSSSVFSEEFGAKTAYLDAIAAKYAVSKPKRSDSRRREGRRSSAASDVSVSSRRSQQSEKWQAFLERKSAAGASPAKSRASSLTEMSQAAEKYAAEKVEEIMAAMSSSRSKSTPRSWPNQPKDTDDPRYRVGELIDSDNISTASSSSPQPRDKPRTQRRSRHNESARAAEELAAARVEAMMAAMSSRDLDEGEI